MTKNSASRNLATEIAKLAWEKKADEISILDVSKVSQFTDYFVIITGQIDQQIKAISDHVVDTLRSRGTKPHHIEGTDNLQWILIDYVDVLVNIFLPEVRQFYDLEALWGEAQKVPLDIETEEQET